MDRTTPAATGIAAMAAVAAVKGEKILLFYTILIFFFFFSLIYTRCIKQWLNVRSLQ